MEIHRLVVRIPKTRHEKFTKAAKKSGRSKRFIINKMIEDFLKSQDNKETA